MPAGAIVDRDFDFVDSGFSSICSTPDGYGIARQDLIPLRLKDDGFNLDILNNLAGFRIFALLEYPGLELIEHAIARRPTTFPYIPGLLSFREIPVLLDAIEALGRRPDLVICDGQGIAHPRRFGLACHLGVLTDLPAIGVAKSRLTGKHEVVPEGGRLKEPKPPEKSIASSPGISRARRRYTRPRLEKNNRWA